MSEPTIQVTAQQFAAAMILEAQIANLHIAVNQLVQMGLKAEAEELATALSFMGRRKAAIESMWQESLLSTGLQVRPIGE